MAAPLEKSLNDLNGKWVMDKSLSDNADPVLALQGVGWITRKAIQYATVTLAAKQYVESDITHVDIEQTATGGIKGTTELRTLDWTERSHEDHVFGNVTGKNRWVKLDEIDDPFLKEGWLAEVAGPNGEGHIQSLVENKENGWTANQIWGFAMVDGKRYYTRRTVVTKGGNALKIRLVYTWQGL